jgi:hypothetical protein
MSNPYLRQLKKKQGSFSTVEGSSNEIGSGNVFRPAVDFFNKNKTIILGATAVAIVVPVGIKIYKAVRGSSNQHGQNDITDDAIALHEQSFDDDKTIFKQDDMIQDMIQGSKAEHDPEDLEEETSIYMSEQEYDNLSDSQKENTLPPPPKQVSVDFSGFSQEDGSDLDIPQGGKNKKSSKDITFSPSDFQIASDEEIDLGVM